MNKTWALGMATASLLALSAFNMGCSSSSSTSSDDGGTGGGTDGGGTHKDGSTTGNDSGGPADGGTGEAGACAPATADTDCKAQGTACVDCCSCFHQHGVTTFNTALENCVCQANVCKTQCAQSLCATPSTNPATGDACDTCVNGALKADAGTGCLQQVVSACKADQDCVQLLTCVNGTSANDPNKCP